MIAEGNYNKQLHWGRVPAWAEDADHRITRYPDGYKAPDASREVAGGDLTSGQLHWSLNGASALTVPGSGSIPDFGARGTASSRGSAQ